MTFGKAKVAERRKEETLLNQKLVEAQILLEGDPQSIILQAAVTNAETKVKAFLEKRVSWMLEVVGTTEVARYEGHLEENFCNIHATCHP